MSLEKLLNITKKSYSPKFMGSNLACCVHCHTDAGSLDGASTVEHMVARMKELEMTHVTVTEHGTLNSAAAIHRVATKMGMKVIHGVEAYLYWPEDKYNQNHTYHITIYFKTKEAFEAYCKLTPLIFSPPRMKITYGDVKGCLYWDDFLEVAKHGIVVGTACIGGWLNKPIIDHGDIEEAKARLQKMISVIGKEQIYDEWIVDDLTHEYSIAEGQEKLTTNEIKPWFSHPDVIRESNRVRWNEVTGPMGIKRIASQDAHYAYFEDKVIQDNKRYGSDWLMSFHQHIKGAEEYAELAASTQGIAPEDILRLIDATKEFVTHFDQYQFATVQERGFLIPKRANDPKAEILERISKSGKTEFSKKEYQDRIEYELGVLSSSDKLDGVSYLLTVSDIAKTAKDAGILINCRGSAGGVLAAYGTGISITDPITYGLPFERFLTTGRIKSMSPPDIDIDTEDKDGLLALMKQEYGDCMLPISTDSLLKPRSAIRDAERYYYGLVRPQTEVLLKTMETIPQGVNETDWLLGYQAETGEHVPGAVETNLLLKEYSEKNTEIWQLVVRMCGVIRQKSVHACGLILSPIPIQSFMPVYRIGGKDGVLCTGYNPKDVEYVGGLKVDILGVSKMATIKKTFDLIEKRHGIKLEWGELPHDEEVYKSILWTGETEATFQTQTSGITRLCVDTRPKSIQDISNLIALFRPSSLDWQFKTDEFEGNAVDFYVKCARKEVSPHFIHPDLIPIYGSTFGVPLMQEQQLRTFRDLAEYSYETAEGVRRAISKKDAKALFEHGSVLKSKVMERGWTERQANDLIEMIQASARYGFNQCLSGNEIIYRSKNDKKSMTIKEMFEVRNNPEGADASKFSKSLHKKYKREGYGKGWSMDENGLLRPNRIVDIRFAGVRQTYVVTTESGRKIVATDNHKFPTETGIKTLSNIKVGESLYVLEGRQESAFVDSHLGDGKSNLPEKGIKGFLRKGKTPFKEWAANSKKIKEELKGVCTECGKAVSRLEIHHRDMDRTNNTLSNLIGLCVSCHKLAHYTEGRVKWGEKGLLTKLEKIVSIEKSNIEETYDVEMEAPRHNFLTKEGIVTCNSHSTSYAIVSYNTAYLKHHYPLEFWCAELSVEAEDEDKIRHYANVLADKMIQPDITKSHYSDWTIQEDKLVAPLVTLKGCGLSFMKGLWTIVNTENLDSLGIEKKESSALKTSKRTLSSKKALII